MKSTNKIIGAITIGMFLSIPVFGQTADTKTETDLVKYKLLGKVKSVSETVKILNNGSTSPSDGMFKSKVVYTFNEQGYITEFVSYNFDQKIDTRQVIQYNSGNKIKEIINSNGKGYQVYNEKFMYNDKNLETEYLYFSTTNVPQYRMIKLYDSNGNVIETKDFGSNSIMKARTTSIFNNLNQEVEKIYYDSLKQVNSSVKYVYNQAGKISEESIYLGDGTLYTKTINEYNTNKDITKSNVFSGVGALLTRDEFEYNKNWKMISQVHFDGNVCTKAFTYKYNSKGLLTWLWDRIKREYTDYVYNSNDYVVKEVVNDDFSEQYRIISKYEYDTNKNWTSKFVNNSSEPTSTITIREITYY